MNVKRLLIAILATSMILLAAGAQALPPDEADGPTTIDAPLQYPPDPMDDDGDPMDDNIDWSAGLADRDDVKAAFDNARAIENDRVRGPGTGYPDIPEITMPSAATWETWTDAQKAQWIINAEREDRDLPPFDGPQDDLMDVAQDYADLLYDINDLRHDADGWPNDRMDRVPLLQNRQRWAENLAARSDSNVFVERVIYVWLYEDCCYCEDDDPTTPDPPNCWGHRHNLLRDDYIEDVCPTGQEGFWGIGRAGGPGYTWGQLLVWDAIDPSSGWPDEPVFTSGAPPSPAELNTDYTHTFVATGYPDVTFSVASGAMPPGLTLNGTTGVMAGPLIGAGSWTFTVRATNGCPEQNANQQVTIQVTGDAPTPPTITSGAPPSPAQVGQAYNHTFTATGDPAPTFSVSSGNLPPGLNLNGTTGALTGTPTTAGTYTFTVRASNGAAPDDTQQVTIVVEQLASPAFTSGPPGPGEVDTAYNHTFTATGDPAPTFSVTSGTLPPGLTLDGTTGALTGTPTTAGDHTFTVTASNGVAPNATQQVTIHVVAELIPPELPAEEQQLPDATAGQEYTETIEAEGNPPPTFEVSEGSPPPGLDLDPGGVISGTPTLPGSYDFEIVADNGVPPTDTMDTIIVVLPSEARLYLPIVIKSWEGGNWESEPNDHPPAEADGPLASGGVYNGGMPTGDDLKDVYFFDLPAKHTVEIWLTDIPHEHDYDLKLTDKDLNELERSATLISDSEHILTGPLNPGRYYIWVLNEGQSGSSETYQLRVVYQ